MLYTKVNFIDATGYTYCWDRYYRQKNTKGFQAATDDAVECCADLNIPFFVDVRNKSWSSGLYVLMTKGILK